MLSAVPGPNLHSLGAGFIIRMHPWWSVPSFMSTAPWHFLCCSHMPIISQPLLHSQGFPRGSDGKESACNAGDPGLIPGAGGDHLEEEMATHSSVLAWRIRWIEEPGGLQSIGSQRVSHDWSNLARRPIWTANQSKYSLGCQDMLILSFSASLKIQSKMIHIYLTSIWWDPPCALYCFNCLGFTNKPFDTIFWLLLTKHRIRKLVTTCHHHKRLSTLINLGEVPPWITR